MNTKIAPVSKDLSIPSGALCQEASMFSKETYIPCNLPAVAVVDNGDSRPYYMCAGRADHNVRNRGARQLNHLTDEEVAARVKPQPKNKRPGDLLASLKLVPSWDQYPKLRDLDFGKLIQARVDLRAEIDFRTKKLKEMDETIQASLAVAGTEKVTWEDRPVSIVHSSSGAKIVPEKLLMAGVPASTIADCTEPGKEYSYLLIGKGGSK